ncbi:MAG: BrnT family toxin [Candidatus Glassbacteria bacterium]
MTFEWDENKAEENVTKHGVSFEEARTVFNDPFSITIYDPDHSAEEDRYIDVGLSSKGRILVVSYTERGENIRIINSREATRRERRDYEER